MTLLFHIGFLEIRFIDILDILLVSLLLYQLYKLLKGSVAVKIFLGLLSIYLFYLVVNAAGMHLLSDILGQFIGVGVLAALILFQQEIRKFLLLIGKTTTVNNEKLYKILHFGKNQQEDKFNPDKIIDAVEDMSKSKTGALIAITQNSELKEYADTGDYLHANLSMRLLLSIFNKHSPMHDGAVIVTGNSITAARCLVPVTERQDIPAKYGMRHRAGIGLSEVTDSLVIIVSEESGDISTAYNGEIKTGLDRTKLRRKLNQIFKPKEDSKKSKRKKLIKKS